MSWNGTSANPVAPGMFSADTQYCGVITSVNFMTQSKEVTCPKCGTKYMSDMNWQPIKIHGKREYVCLNCYYQDLKFKEAIRSVRNTRLKAVKNRCPR